VAAAREAEAPRPVRLTGGAACDHNSVVVVIVIIIVIVAIVRLGLRRDLLRLAGRFLHWGLRLFVLALHHRMCSSSAKGATPAKRR
jgi:hypothetical protein